MTKDELIAKQQIEIEEYKFISENNAKIKKELHGEFYAIGKPLNDNKLQFCISQLKWCYEVIELIDLIK